MGFLNLMMLAGLAAVAIPPLIHLLNRRRHDVVDWGAMQFLLVSQTTRRKLLLDELILMALRMGLIALLVLALAAPYAVGSWLGKMQTSRDVVLVIDGTASMDLTGGDKATPFDAARAAASEYLQGLAQGDRVAVLLARQPPELVVGEFTQDRLLVHDTVAELPAPRGVPDWPRTLEAALGLLKEQGRHPRQEIVLFSDLQKHGWTDPRTLTQWERLAPQWHLMRENLLKISAVDVAPEAPRDWPNYAVAPLKTTRSLAWLGQLLKVQGALRLSGLTEFAAPHRLRYEIDGQVSGDIALPRDANVVSGQIPFHFHHRFDAPGTHLVSVIVEPDPPESERPAGYRLRDCLPADNRQDIVVEVVRELPVLLVDGADKLTPESSTFFLDKALAGPADSKQAATVLAETIIAADLTAALLAETPGRPRPRVLVLADVPRLEPAQVDAVEQYVAEGGSVLVVLGPRTERDFFNEHCYRNGHGWLPVKLDKIEGDETKPELAARPDAKRFQHPALEMFQDDGGAAFAQVRLPRWWKVTAAARASVGALLTSTDPLLVEQAYKKGRVMVCTAPLDRAWGSNFPSLWEFPVLVHELIYSLADSRAGEWNVQPGQPVRLRPQAFGGDAPPERLLITPPVGKPLSVRPDAWPWSFAGTGAVGAYRVQAEQRPPVFFAVHGDPRESDLTPCSAEDRRRLAQLVPLRFGLAAAAEEAGGTEQRHDLWWMFMIGVIVLLCGEIWFTRRLVRKRTTPLAT